MTTRTPVWHVGDRVLVNGEPHHPTPEIREGGPGRVIAEQNANGCVWVRLDSGAWRAYLPCELREEPPI